MHEAGEQEERKRERMSSTLDVFGGASIQVLGTEVEEGVVYSVSLKRVRYRTQPSDGGHLQWNSHKIRTLKAGTVDKLVEYLAPWKDPLDVSYRTCFLSTYRTFATPDTVLQLLLRRFRYYQPDDGAKDTEDKAAVQSHVISFLCHWLESYPQDFHSPPAHPLLAKLHPLTISHVHLQRIVDNLLLDFETRDFVKRGRSGVSVDSGLGVPIEDSDPVDECDGLEDFDLGTLKPQQFAQCLTALDAEVFQRITPHHCLDYVRDSKNADNAPSVRACIQHFNRVSLIVIATVIGGTSPEGRALKIVQWIDIASECRAIKNFSSLKAIISGLQSTAVYRLKRSWQSLPSSKQSLFDELSGLLATDGNHQTSRDLLTREGTAKYAELSPRKSKAGPLMGGSVQGVVPYLGMFLTDLTMVHSAHKDVTETGLINFDKRRKLFELLAQLTLYQKSAANYRFPCHSGLTAWLHSTPTLTAAESYKISGDLETADYLTPSSVANKILLSPARLRYRLKTLFSTKGAVVGDSHTLTLPRPHTLTPSLPSSPTHTTKTLLTNTTASIDNLLDVHFDSDSIEMQSKIRKRSNSMSPSIGRRYCGRSNHSDTRPHPLPGHVVRVALTHSDHCNYKCLLVTEGDRTGAVVARAIKKFSLKGSPADYTLVQLLEENRTMVIPRHGNVYFALNTTETKATLLLIKSEI